MESEKNKLREEELKKMAKKIQESGIQLSDIREREWISHDCDAAKLLKLLIEAENLFMGLDEYQMEHDQCYPDIEDMMLLMGDLRAKFIEFVEKNPEVLNVKIK